jgi:large subunit ribosomal protein L6
MSRIGKLAIKVPEKVNITISPTNVTVKGPKGELSRELPNAIKIIQNDKIINIIPNESLSNIWKINRIFKFIISTRW